MHVALCLVNFQECERTTKTIKRTVQEYRVRTTESRIAGVSGSDNDRRSIGFRQWKAESQEYRVRTMESRIAGVSGSDNGKPDRRSNGFRRWKAGSQEYRVQTMES